MSDTGIVIDQIGGNCPVQAEGTIDGEPFYFRARGKHWSMSIGGDDVVGKPHWFFRREYGDTPFAAGWMSEDEARRFIEEAAERWRDRNLEHDGQPDEQQEWRDYDPDC